MKRIPLLFLFFVSLFFIMLNTSARAQVQKTSGSSSTPVTGIVRGANGQPLDGVNILLKGSSRGTATDAKGNFTISAEPGQTLVFSYVGYHDLEVTVTADRKMTIALELDMSSLLQETVVTGYTTEKKKDITGSVSVVNIGDMVKIPSALITDQLQGQASGVTVISSGQPGADPQIRIRGINTFGNNSPLYVVDGVPTQNIADININDIASLQVLKDAGASSIYGSRASNGVIIITSKRGAGKTSVHYDAYYGTQQPQKGNVWNLLNPQEQANLEWIALKNSGNANPSDPLYGNGASPVLPDYIAPVGAKEGDPSVNPDLYNVNPFFTDGNEYTNFHRITRANKSGTDWYHELFKPAYMTSHNLSVQGGTDKGMYFFSVNYLNQEGTLIETYLKRYSIRSNAVYNVSKHVRIGENLETSISHNPTISDIPTDNNLQGTSPVFFSLQIPPIIPVHDIKGNYAGVFGTGLNGPNPVAMMERTKNNRDVANRLFGNVYADVDFLDAFTFHTSFGGENFSGARHSFNYPTYENSGNNTVNSYSQSAYSGFTWTWTNTLGYKKQIGNSHHVSALIGTEAYQAQTESIGGTTQDYFSFDPNYTTLSSGAGVQTNQSGRSKESLASEFARADYAFRDKYLFSATIRRDGSSKFVKYQYGWFPSVSAGWRITEEKFMKPISWLTDLKIRASWGSLGNQLNVNPNNGYYVYVLNINEAYYDIAGTNNSNAPGFQVGQIANKDAKWEKDNISNAGIDATLFNGKVTLSADYYEKNIKDLLYNPAEPGTAGLGTAPFVNIAGVKNRGVDVALNYHQDITRKLKLDAGLTFTTYHNRVTKVTDEANYFWTNDQRHYGSDFIRNEVGHPIGAFYGYKITGFWNSAADITTADAEAVKATNNNAATYQTDAAVGRFRYADVNGDHQITDADRTFLGDPNPKFNYGLNLRLTYGPFDVSAFIYGVQGNNLWNVTKFWTDFYGFAEAKSKTALYDAWTPEHHNATAPIQELGQFASTNGTPNSYYVENGSYLKLKSFQIGYSLPSPLLKKAGIERCRIYVQGANLFTVTKYSGIDPEISGSVTDFGVDEGIYPNVRQFLAGINLSF